MPYDPVLADRIRAVLGDWDADHDDELGLVEEKQMFGGLGFMVAGSLAVCAGSSGDLMVRALKADVPALLAIDGVAAMTMGARTMNGWVLVANEPLSDAALRSWIERGVTEAARVASSR